MFDFLRLLFTKGTRGIWGGVEEFGVGWKASKEDHVRSVANGHAIFGSGEHSIYLRCPRVCRWWSYKRPADEVSSGCIGNGPRRAAGGCSGCFGFSAYELVAGDSFVSWYLQERFWARSSVEE